MIIETSLIDVVPKALLAVLSEQAIDKVMGDIAKTARNHWIGLAQRYLHTSRNDYISSIQAVAFSPGTAVITLLGQPANLIENGASAMDMRDTLLGPNVPLTAPGSPGKHLSKTGSLYRSIPFRHGTPGTSGSVGSAMGDPYRGVVAGARKLGREVYREAKKLSATTTRGGKTMYGRRLRKGLVPKLKEHHKTDIYAGMLKLQKTYKKATQSQYMTFRTISTSTDIGWIRPATGPRDFAGRTATFIQDLAPKAFKAYVDGVVQGHETA